MPPEDPGKCAAEGLGSLWDRQDGQKQEFDYEKYNSVPWMLAKTLFAVCMITAAYLLYALSELPWGLFGSVSGIMILVMAPFFAGLILGFAFESPRRALAFSVVVGFISVGLCLFLMMLPKLMGLAEYGSGFMTNLLFYGFFIPFLVTVSFVPAGAMLSASTNVFE